jgi:hypothetical protein
MKDSRLQVVGGGLPAAGSKRHKVKRREEIPCAEAFPGNLGRYARLSRVRRTMVRVRETL